MQAGIKASLFGLLGICNFVKRYSEFKTRFFQSEDLNQ